MFPLHSFRRPSETATTIALAVCQLFDGLSDMSGNPPAEHFLESFLQHWPRLSLPLPRPVSGFAWNEGLVLHYHMRFLSVSETRGPTSPVCGLKRDQGWIRTRGIRRYLFVTERRISIALRTTSEMDLPIFLLVLLTDLGGLDRPRRGKPSESLVDLDSRDKWEELGIRPAIRQTGISALAFRLYTLCFCWAAEWDSTLKTFESHINVEVSALDVLAPLDKPVAA